MKKHISLVAVGLMLMAFPYITSCRKQLTEPAGNEIVSASPVSSNCNAISHNYYRPDLQYWKTLMHRWYDVNGNLVYLKAYIPGEAYYIEKEEDYNDFEINIDWGEITRSGNQVFLKDVLNDKIILKVTLDDQQRPIASYLFNDHAPFWWYRIDTSYYYYVGNRLDSMESFGLRKVRSIVYPYSSTYKFLYDQYGNIRHMNNNQGLTKMRINFIYDYSSAMNGIEPNYYVSTQLRLLEYMQLVKFPMHNLLNKVVMGAYYPGQGYPDDTPPKYVWEYKNLRFVPDNLVYSYTEGFFTQGIFYTGWQCGLATPATTNLQSRAGFRSLQEFQRSFPEPKK
ncbi:MAG TPA: hypothetical protein VGD17_08065 [Chitinophagaceae bacterium]